LQLDLRFHGVVGDPQVAGREIRPHQATADALTAYPESNRACRTLR
jgi:hypothetical protein